VIIASTLVHVSNPRRLVIKSLHCMGCALYQWLLHIYHNIRIIKYSIIDQLSFTWILYYHYKYTFISIIKAAMYINTNVLWVKYWCNRSTDINIFVQVWFKSLMPI
jgi:hypothetical protein